MEKLKKTLIYKIAREIKNFIYGIFELIYWYTYRIILVIKEHPVDKRLGIETSEPYRRRSDISLFKDLCDYHPSPYGKIEKVIAYLKLNPEDVFVDLGCGKGRVLFLVAQKNLKKVVGVEVDKELSAIARDNYCNLKSKNTPIEILDMDAALYNAGDGTVFFMYDPFGYKTVEAVVKNIRDSIKKNPRRIRIVYFSPGYRHLLDNEDWLELEKELEGGEVVIWRSSTSP